MKVHVRTNLDLSNEKWPDELPAVPNVGDHITSAVIHQPAGFQLTLQVTRVTWKAVKPRDSDYGRTEWIPSIELHMTDWQQCMPPKNNPDGDIANGSITAFYQWYAPLVGRSVGAFI